MPVTVTADGKEYYLDSGVWIVQTTNPKMVEKAFKELGGSAYILGGHSTNSFEHDVDGTLEGILQDMGWVFENMEIGEPDGDVLSFLAKCNAGKLQSYPLKVEGGRLMSAYSKEAEVPEDIGDAQKISWIICDNEPHHNIERRVIKKLKPMNGKALAPGGGAFRGANVAADMYRILKGPGEKIVCLNPNTDSCQDEVDAPLLALMPYLEETTVLVNDSVGESVVSIARPYFSTLYLGRVESLKIEARAK